MSENCTHDCGSCQVDCSSRQAPADMKEKLNEYSSVKKVIGVVSGKGGVGKSFVTSLLAVQMNRRGYRTAVLDADVTGPSIPKVFGLKEKAMGNETGLLYPVTTPKGIEVMSVNLLLENDDAPVVWRGPIIAGTAVLERCDLGKYRLYVCGYAAGYGRCPAHSIPVPPAGWHNHGDFPAGTGIFNCFQGSQYGENDACTHFGPGGKHELCGMPGLWETDFRFWGKPFGRNRGKVPVGYFRTASDPPGYYEKL